MVQKYTTIIDDLLALIDVTGQGASDATLGQAIRVLGLVSRMKEEASEQRGDPHLRPAAAAAQRRTS